MLSSSCKSILTSSRFSSSFLRIQSTTKKSKQISSSSYNGITIINTAKSIIKRSTSSTTSSPNNKNIKDDDESNQDTMWTTKRVNAYVGHTFPDFIEKWNRKLFRQVGYSLNGSTFLLASIGALYSNFTVSISLLPAGILGVLTLGYWRVGLNDIRQTQHAVRRNYPVIGNIRYIMETIRPEIRQYIVESDLDGRPFDRMTRAAVYNRAKNVDDTLPFGTRRSLYDINREWVTHSMFPKTVHVENARHVIGSQMYGTTKPYSSSVFNISAMSFGAISENAILALNNGARLGNFSHNTGEGSISSFHRKGGGDLVWNIGTGYFGCGSGDVHRVFEPSLFQETLEEANGKVKMIELKLSQGAKPGHGGLLPRAKITKDIADARKLSFPAVADCHSPSTHSAFKNHHEMVEFIAKLRELSGGLPVGIKLCVGHPGDIARLCRAMRDLSMGPDFITVDGAEGGTGAAPPEFSDSVGLPLQEGLVLVRNMLIGTNLKENTKIIASGRIITGFDLIRALALGADVTNSARGFMLSLGCIQALKCNTNTCPTGIATQNKELMYGLDPHVKTVRVYNFHSKTIKAACEMAGAMGYDSLDDVCADDVMRRVRTNQVCTLSEHFPTVEPGSLLDGKGPERLQGVWDASKDHVSSYKRWIY